MKKQTEEISKTIEKEETKENKNKKNPVVRIRETNEFQIIRKFQELLQQYSNLQAEYKEKYTEKLVNNYKITHPESNDEEVQELLQTKKLQETYKKKTNVNKNLESTFDVLYQEAVKKIFKKKVETQQDLVYLQNSLQELQELFITMSNLVESQDDLIDNISKHVLDATAYVEEAKNDLVTGKSAQEKVCIIS
jgi:syntaxin 1B/2/3